MNMDLDIHHHFISRVAKQYLPDLHDWSITDSLKYLDDQGIKKAVLSLSNYDISFNTKEEYIIFCSGVNEELSSIIRKHPDRFEGFGILPFPHIAESIRELVLCLKKYSLKGIILYTNFKSEYPSSRDHKELFSYLNEHKVTVFVHPGTTPLIKGQKYDALSEFIEESQEVARLMSRLLIEQCFEVYPNIDWIMGQGAGAFFFLMDRIGMIPYIRDKKPRIGRIIVDMITKRYRTHEYIKKMRFDLYDSMGIEQLAAMEPYVKEEQHLFGSNFPYTDD